MVSEDDVKRLALLSRLKIDEGYVPTLANQLNSILEYVKRLDSVDTTGVEAMSHTQKSTNVYRQDNIVGVGGLEGKAPGELQGMLPTSAVTDAAPDRSGRFYRVPLVVE
jgi:aspartyl-tRNA(Asn)/glutamyl-tRNA(Gln) amidotransferase subunit C